MKVDPALLRRLRDERAWSQEQLAAVSGLSLRTVQRVESVGTASAETRMALATAFGVELRELRPPVGAPAVESAPTAPTAAAPAAADTGVTSVRLLPHRAYRLLRRAVVLGLVVAIDVSESGRITWSKWVLVFGLAFILLRLFRHRFEGGQARRRESRIVGSEKSS